MECSVSEKMLQYFISRSAYAYQERRDGKDESIDLYQISIFIKQIAFDPMVGMKLAIELFDSGNKSLMIYGMLLRNYRIAKKALLLSGMEEKEILT